MLTISLFNKFRPCVLSLLLSSMIITVVSFSIQVTWTYYVKLVQCVIKLCMCGMRLCVLNYLIGNEYS